VSAGRVLRDRLPSRGDDEGLTLVELCVAMVITGVVAVMIATTTIQAFRIQRDTVSREDDSTAASLAMEVLSRDVRQALAPQLADTTSPAFSVATPTSVTLVTWVGIDPVKVSYVLDAGTLTRSVQSADAAGAGAKSAFVGPAVPTSRVLARHVTSTALFGFVKSGGTTVFPTLGGSDLALVRGVRVDLTVDSDGPGRLPGTQLRNTVTCLNL